MYQRLYICRPRGLNAVNSSVAVSENTIVDFLDFKYLVEVDNLILVGGPGP